MVRLINRAQILTKMGRFLDSAFGTPAPDHFIFVEVGSSEEYDREHIAGAIFLDPRHIHQSHLLLDFSTEIVIYSSSAYREKSIFVAHTLLNLGHRNIFLYLNGKEDWRSYGGSMKSTLVPANHFTTQLPDQKTKEANRERPQFVPDTSKTRAA